MILVLPDCQTNPGWGRLYQFQFEDCTVAAVCDRRQIINATLTERRYNRHPFRAERVG